ncbi:MAG: hypothetical protein ACTHNS_13680 [Marmoricola sp.]
MAEQHTGEQMSQQTGQQMGRRSRLRAGAGLLNRNFGRVLVFAYGVLALSATGRAVVQIATKFDKAPGPYTLSALAALVYIAATWALGTSRNRTAVGVVTVEFLGVLIVGATHPASVPLDKQTVWTDYGSGYGYVPLLLPFVVVWWLWYNRPRPKS